MEYILQRRLAIVCFVSALHFLFFLLIQIITFTIQDLLFQLGIELLVIDAFIGNHLGHFHTKKASASRRVAQDLTAIGGSNEGSQTRLGDIPQTLSAIYRYGYHLKQVLQVRLAFFTNFIKLVEVDEAAFYQFLFR